MPSDRPPVERLSSIPRATVERRGARPRSLATVRLTGKRSGRANAGVTRDAGPAAAPPPDDAASTRRAKAAAARTRARETGQPSRAGSAIWRLFKAALVLLVVYHLLWNFAGRSIRHGIVPQIERHVRELLGEVPATPAPTAVPAAKPSPLARLHAAIDQHDEPAVAAALAGLPREMLDRPQRGMTSVMRAAAAGDTAILRVLLDAGASPNARGSGQRTALQYAVQSNHTEAARMLLDAGADIDGVDNGSLSPLIMAADRDYTDLALMLIERGANVNLQNVQGWTALMDAAQAGNVRVVRALLAAGARTAARHSNGWTALDFARQGGHVEVVRLLTARGGDAPALRTGAATPQAGGKPAASTGEPAQTSAGLPPKKGARP